MTRHKQPSSFYVAAAMVSGIATMIDGSQFQEKGNPFFIVAAFLQLAAMGFFVARRGGWIGHRPPS